MERDGEGEGEGEGEHVGARSGWSTTPEALPGRSAFALRNE